MTVVPLAVAVGACNRIPFSPSEQHLSAVEFLVVLSSRERCTVLLSALVSVVYCFRIRIRVCRAKLIAYRRVWVRCVVMTQLQTTWKLSLYTVLLILLFGQ